MKPRVSKSQLTSIFAANARSARPQRSRPFSIRLSEAERQRLQREAGSQALGAYLRARLLAGAVRRRSGSPAADLAVLGAVLGKLGRLKLAHSLSELAEAARAGASTMSPELERDIRAACLEIRDIRAKLMQALGLHAEGRA